MANVINSFLIIEKKVTKFTIYLLKMSLNTVHFIIFTMFFTQQTNSFFLSLCSSKLQLLFIVKFPIYFQPASFFLFLCFFSLLFSLLFWFSASFGISSQFCISSMLPFETLNLSILILTKKYLL